MPISIPSLSEKEMYQLLQDKKSRRGNLNIFVLSGRDHELNCYNSELYCFFKILSKNIGNKNLPRRFQLAINDPGHWFAVDCYIKNDQLNLFVLDAAWRAREEKGISSVQLVKDAVFPLKANLFTYRGVLIQNSTRGCSFFTADHVFRLSNRDEHWNDLLALTKKPDEKGVVSFDEKECPNSLAFIFKNIQSLENLNNKLPERLKKVIINKKEETLEYIVEKNSVYNEELKQIINEGMIRKKDKYMRFFPSGSHSFTSASRQGFEIIGGELGELVKKIIDAGQDTPLLKSLLITHADIIQANSREILDIVLHYSLHDLFCLLKDHKYLPPEECKKEDLLKLVGHNKIHFFKSVFEFVKDNLSATAILALSNKISLQFGRTEFKIYFEEASKSLSNLPEEALTIRFR